jgi:inorganic pyrophosphatase
MKILTALALCACILVWSAPAPAQTAEPSAARVALYGAPNFLSGYPARNDDGTVNVVVEIPAGTNAKWEVSKSDGALRWEMKDGQPRVVQYLAYPGNYGMVPSTLLARELGGDGDPLNVLLLGPAVERGSVVRVRLIGVLELLDRGERDDKLLVVSEDSPLGAAQDLATLDAGFPGAKTILQTWFANYKGPGEIQIKGFGDRARAEEILSAAAAAYAERAKK